MKSAKYTFLYNMNAQNLFDTYFENIRVLSRLFFSNSRFTLELYGDSFNSSSPLLCRESDSELSCSFPSCHALFVHPHRVVIEDESLSSNVDEDDVLKFVCKNVGPFVNGDYAVYLRPTADTRDLLESGGFELSVIADDNDTGEYVFWRDSMSGLFPGRILFCYSPFIELSESEDSAVVFDHRAVQTTIALASESWPNAALSWPVQCHPWLSDDMINTVASSTVYFVPKPISDCCDTGTKSHLFWKPEFIVAEDLLMKCLSVEVKIAYQLLLQLVVMHHFALCCISQEFLIKHALFWCLDEMSVKDDWKKKSVIEYYMQTLKTLHLFLCERRFPHYFMPDVNILCHCDSSFGDISWMEAAVIDVTVIQLKAEATQQILTSTSSDVTGSISRHLKALYSRSISMSYIQLFQYLHAGASVDDLIAKHHDVLSCIHTQALVTNHLFLKPLIAWINSSLGNVYLVKASTASSGQHWAEFAEKAEHCMLEAVAGNNMPCCILYLIQFLLKMKCYRAANSYMEELLSHTEFTWFSAVPNPDPTENCASSALAFSDELLRVWHHASWYTDVMFSPLEVSVLLPQLQSSLSFAYCVEIGYNDPPVAVLKVDVWMQYIGALCCMNGDGANVLKFLADAERSLIVSVPTADISDRAHVTYFNMLAGTLQRAINS